MSAARMPLTYDSVHYICVKIFKEYNTNNDIKGIVIGEKELKITSFGDDTTMYIGNNSCLAHLEMQLTYFEKVTDMKYNKTKCMGIWLGSNKGNPRKLLGFK